MPDEGGTVIDQGVLLPAMTAELTVGSLESPDETATFDNGQLDTTQVEDVSFMVGTVEPGWVWSRDNGPARGTESCPLSHQVYMRSGKMTVEMDDGTAETEEQGDVAIIPPGHDAWTEGDEEAVFIDIRI